LHVVVALERVAENCFIKHKKIQWKATAVRRQKSVQITMVK